MAQSPGRCESRFAASHVGVFALSQARPHLAVFGCFVFNTAGTGDFAGSSLQKGDREMKSSDRIFVALDNMSRDAAIDTVGALAHYGVGFKVGLELICGFDAEAVLDSIRKFGGRAILDVKLNDIPNTMAQAVLRISEQKGVAGFTVHASASLDGMQAAASVKDHLDMLAVTVLTSMGDAEAAHVFGAPSAVKVLEFARDAKLSGADGLVCSPLELSLLRSRPEVAGLFIMTPGVRPAWAATGDQKRVLTPGEAIRAGARWLVIGRPITAPPKEIGTPAQALRLILDEIDAVR
jgi:orotidine-5'-phosphate decarboxylase